MFKKGFTLAEVLITLAIIGIVAALTIPSVISNYQQQEFKTGLKKAVSVLNEAIQTNIAQDGETPYENADLFNYLQKHMSILKTARYNTCYDSNGSFIKGSDMGGDSCKGQDDNFIQAPVENMAFYTTDGMRFEFLTGNYSSNDKRSNIRLYESGVNPYYRTMPKYDCFKYGPNNEYEYCSDKTYQHGNAWCGSYGLKDNPNNTVTPPCVVLVDVNGDKKPNPPMAYDTTKTTKESWYGSSLDPIYYTYDVFANQNFQYSYPSPTDKKLSDVFNILVTENKAIPFGVVAQRAMYSSK